MKRYSEMIRKKHLLLFLLAVSVSLFVTGTVFTLAGGGTLHRPFFYQFALNLPVCILLGGIDLLVVYCLRKTRLSGFKTVRIALDLLLTSFLSLLIPAVCNYLLTDITAGEAVTRSLPVIPWNWIMVLAIEIYFYNTDQLRSEREKARYKYEVLKNQVNPHFLFNCLNVLSSLAYSDAEKANLFAKRLSGVYRYILDTRETDKVTTDVEMAFVRSYIYLESVRFSDTLQVSVSDTSSGPVRHVIPTSIQMLVENALKHNINTGSSPLKIQIGISDEGVSVSNNIQLRSHVSRHGIGLRNLMQQYMLHGKEIRIIRTPDTFTVVLPYV